MHYGGGGYAHYQSQSGGSFGPRYATGSQGNFVHSSSLNSQNSHHPNGNSNWGHNDWDHGFQNHYWGAGWHSPWNWGWGWGWGYPFWSSFWGGYPFGWGGYWADYFCPYGNTYPVNAYSYVYPDDNQYGAYYAPGPAPAAVPETSQPVADDGNPAVNEGLQYYNEARAAFARGDFQNALRLAGHSGVESPQNAKVHELLSLSMFASGEYRLAATEAHAALALGAPSDWKHLYDYYHDVDRYTQQLRKLEKTVADVPNSAPGHFLLGYHYLMTGAKEEAKTHFAEAAKLTPNDKLAAHILKELESGGTVKPPELPKPPPSEQKGKAL